MNYTGKVQNIVITDWRFILNKLSKMQHFILTIDGFITAQGLSLQVNHLYTIVMSVRLHI